MPNNNDTDKIIFFIVTESFITFPITPMDNAIAKTEEKKLKVKL